MHFCAFWLLPKFNTRCSVNLMFAKSLFSEICTQKAHFAQLGAVLGSIRRAGRCCGQGAPFYTPLPKSNGFESRTKVEPKSKGHPLPKSRMILREKISGKVELGLNYALFNDDRLAFRLSRLIFFPLSLVSPLFWVRPCLYQAFPR